MECPWHIDHEMKELKQLMSSMNCCLMHVYKEGNKGADFLANWGCSHKNEACFDATMFPRALRGTGIERNM